jgi:hypothetical protein
MYRTDLLTHDMNQIKKDQLLDLLKVYQKTAIKIADAHWKLFNLNSKDNNRPDFDKYSKEITGINSVLNTMYKQMCQSQVVGQLDSYISNRQNDFKYIVSKSGKYARCTTGKYEFPADPMLSNNKFVVGNIGNVKPSFG